MATALVFVSFYKNQLFLELAGIISSNDFSVNIFQTFLFFQRKRKMKVTFKPELLAFTNSGCTLFLERSFLSPVIILLVVNHSFNISIYYEG